MTAGDSLPFFEVDTVDGGRVRYAELWQRKNVVLVCLPPSDANADYANALARRSAEFDEYCAVCIVTRDRVPGISPPAVIVADRWGEIQLLASSEDLPAPQALLETLDYVQRRCPECEGESR